MAILYIMVKAEVANYSSIKSLFWNIEGYLQAGFPDFKFYNYSKSPKFKCVSDSP